MGVLGMLVIFFLSGFLIDEAFLFARRVLFSSWIWDGMGRGEEEGKRKLSLCGKNRNEY